MDKRDADNRWPGIFYSIGIDVGEGKHTTCPICGKKKFRFDDKNGTGSWICCCGSGDGWALVQKVLNCDFKSAIEEVGPIVGNIVPSAACEEKKRGPEYLREIFKGSKAATDESLVGRYLKSRGLVTVPSCLRHHPKCYENETKQNHHAMLAVVQLPCGKATTMHRTYLTAEGEKLNKIDSPKKMMPGVEKSTGGAIRLFEPREGIIAVAEGIETAIACHELHDMPTWATVSAAMMISFQPPPGIKKVYIFGDNDSHRTYAGQAAAFSLAKRLIEINKVAAEVFIPDFAGDWLDELNRRKQENT